MKMLDIEKIVARKFIEIKGMEYFDSNKYTMSKNVMEVKESNEIKFEFFIAKARPKQDGKIVVDESIPWDEIVLIYVDKETRECRVAVEVIAQMEE